MIDNSDNPFRSPNSEGAPRHRGGVGALSSTPLRNVVTCGTTLLVCCIFDWFYVRSGQPANEWAQWVFIAAFYFAILWANKNLFRRRAGTSAAWIGRALVSALLFPVYAYIIAMLFLWFHFAIGGRL